MTALRRSFAVGAGVSAPRRSGMLAGLDWGRLEMAKRLGVIRERRWQHGTSYEIELWDHGKRYRIGAVRIGGQWSPLHSRDVADLVLQSIRADVAQGASVEQAVAPFLRRPTAATRVPTKLAAWLDLQAERESAGDLSPTTLREYRRYAREGGEFSFFDAHHIFAVRYAELEDWRSWLGRRGLGAKTVANVMGAFRAFLGWLARRGDIASVPPFPRVPQTDHAPQILTPQAQAAVLAAIPWERRGVFLAMVHGLRPGEARGLELRDYRDGDLMVRRAAKGSAASAPVREAKERNWRLVAADADLQRWIGERLEAASPAERLKGLAPLFPGPRGGRWSYWALRDAWYGGCDAAKVPRVRPYEGTKHSTGTDLLRRKLATLDEVQHFFGHKERRSTERYARYAERDVVELQRRRPRGE